MVRLVRLPDFRQHFESKNGLSYSCTHIIFGPSVDRNGASEILELPLSQFIFITFVLLGLSIPKLDRTVGEAN